VRKSSSESSNLSGWLVIFSPLDVSVGDFKPAFLADRQLSALIIDVELDVCVLTLAVPRVSAMFSRSSHVCSSDETRKFCVHLKHSTERQPRKRREKGENGSARNQEFTPTIRKLKSERVEN